MEEFVLEKILYHTTFLSKTHSGYYQGWFKRPLPSAQCHHSKKPHKCKDDSMNIYFISYPVIFLLTVILHPVVSNPTSVALKSAWVSSHSNCWSTQTHPNIPSFKIPHVRVHVSKCWLLFTTSIPQVRRVKHLRYKENSVVYTWDLFQQKH